VSDQGAPRTFDEKLEEYFLANLGDLMTLPKFRVFLQHIIDRPDWGAAAANAADFNSSSKTYFDLGRQSIATQLRNRAQQHPDLFMRMGPETLAIHKLLITSKD
jgi:hypothetical protein